MKPAITFKDPMKKLFFQNQTKNNRIIEDSIKLVLNHSSAKEMDFQSNKNSKLLNKFVDVFPYYFIGLVESTFVNEKKSEKYKEFGIGLLLEEDIVMVNASNLIMDSDFTLFDIEFSLLNLSESLADFFPKKIKVNDYYCPLEEEMPEEEKIINSWGLIILEMPIASILSHLLNKNMKINLEFVKNQDINSSDLLFLDLVKSSEAKQHNPETFKLVENSYEVKLDENLMILQNIEECLPGVILNFSKGKFHLIGLNTSIKVKLENENVTDTKFIQDSTRLAIRFENKTLRSIQSKIKEIISINSYPAKFSGVLFEIFYHKINSLNEIKNLLRDNAKNLVLLFNYFLSDTKISNRLNKFEKESLDISYGKSFPNQLITTIFSLIWNKFNSGNKSIINLENLNIGTLPCTLILSQILNNSDQLTTLNLKGNLIFSKGLKNLIKQIYNTKQLVLIGQHIKIINLEKNKLSSKALKYLRHFLKVSRDLEFLSLNSNYICAKGLKYLKKSDESKREYSNLRYLGLAYNMLGPSSGEDLAEIIKDCPNLDTLHLESNNLTDEALCLVMTRLSEITDENGHNLKHLYLGSNNLSHESATYLGQWLGYNSQLEVLWLNNNNLSDEGADLITKSLSERESDEGIIKKNYKKNTMNELNFSNINLNPGGASEIFKNLKENTSLKKLNLNFNNISDQACVDLANLLNCQTERKNGFTHLFLSNCEIRDSGATFIASQIINHPDLIEVKLNSNYITDTGGEILLYAILSNSKISSFHFENNITKWRDYNLDIKKARGDLQVFFN
jgi:Ran GTPase-activating protein (RanGAP) involved in mRNA processing and transport